MQMLRRNRRVGLQLASAPELMAQYGVAILASVVAIALWQFALKQASLDPYLLLLAAVAISSLFGGFGPGLVSALVTTALAVALYADQKHKLQLLSSHQQLQVSIYVIVAFILNWLIAVQRRGQIDLRNQLRLSANITRNLGEGVYSVDRQGNVVLMNPAAQEMLGYTESELRGKDFHAVIHPCVDGVTPDGRACPLPDILRSGATVRNDDDEFIKKDRSMLPVSYTCSPVLADGKISGAVLTFRDISDRKRAMEAMRASEERYRILVQTSHDSIWLTDLYGYVIMANERAAKLYGYMTANEMLGMNSVELIASDDRVRSVQDRRKAAEHGGVVTGEYLSLKHDGSSFPSEISHSIVMDDDEQPRAILHVARDITERRRSQSALESSETRLSMQYAATSVLAQADSLSEAVPKLVDTLAQNSNWAVGLYWTFDSHDNVLRCRNVRESRNVKLPGFRKLSQQLTCAPGVDLPGRVLTSGQPVWVPDVVTDDNFPRALMASKEGLHGGFAFPVIIGQKVQSVIEFFSFDPVDPSEDLTQSAITIAAQLAQFIERKQAEEALEYHALHDALTDLPNRTLIQDRLQLALASAQRNSKPLALMIMDVDRFREINETFGHRTGDHLLQQIAPRLKGALRESDTAGRIGGDEFAIILPATDAAGSNLVAQKVLVALSQPLVVEGHSFDVGATIGIAVYPDHGVDADSLLRQADIAMSAAKQRAAGYALYDAQDDRFSPSRASLKKDLRQAIENDEFLLHFQPKIDLNTGKVQSLEALVRWQHPEHGLLGPDQFLALTEQSGLMQLLSLQVLGAALRQCRSWQTAGLDMRVAVNFSTSSLQDQQLVGTISGMLKAYEIAPDRLEVEIMEGALRTDTERVTQVLGRLHDLGVRISIDDFGTGHSSLGQLKQMPADQIKIDRSVVTDMATKDEDAFIVRSIIDLGHRLGMQVVAEGVENQETADILVTLGCDLAQGTFMSPPLPAEDVARHFRGPEATLTGVR